MFGFAGRVAHKLQTQTKQAAKPNTFDAELSWNRQAADTASPRRRRKREPLRRRQECPDRIADEITQRQSRLPKTKRVYIPGRRILAPRQKPSGVNAGVLGFCRGARIRRPGI